MCKNGQNWKYLDWNRALLVLKLNNSDQELDIDKFLRTTKLLREHLVSVAATKLKISFQSVRKLILRKWPVNNISYFYGGLIKRVIMMIRN